MIEEEIVKTALLGTDRYQPSLQLDFSDIMQKISEKETDKESRFLKQTATYFILKAAAFPLSDIRPQYLADNPSEKYISSQAQQILQAALEEDNRILLQYCFFLFNKKKETIAPFLVPDILEKFPSGNQRKDILPLCGFIGKEILKYQGETVTHTTVVEDDVEVASFVQIKDWIKTTRETDPLSIWNKREEKSQSAFQEILNNEKPDRRAELLGLLQIGISPADEPFLIPQLKGKSKAVKTSVIRLLLQIKDSKVQQDFTALLNELVTKEIKKQLLGFKKTTVLVLTESHVLSAEQKAYGLEEISNIKGISDGLYQLGQCIELMPLALMANALGVSEEDIIQSLFTNWNYPYIKQAFVTNAKAFRDLPLSKAILQSGEYMELAAYLSMDEALAFYKNAFKSSILGTNNRDNFYQVFQWLWNIEGYPDIDLEMSMSILGKLKTSPYTIEGRYYYQLGLYLPKDVKPWLEKEIGRQLGPNENSYFSLHIQQTLKAIEDKSLLNQ